MNRINSHYLRKLHMEIAIMKQVDHPNIIKLRDVFFGSRTVYLVMELCKGGELFDEVTRKAQNGLPEIQTGRLMSDMLSAVLYLHHKGIAHRDLKLENFLFEDPGMQNPLKLIDFGLSRYECCMCGCVMCMCVFMWVDVDMGVQCMLICFCGMYLFLCLLHDRLHQMGVHDYDDNHSSLPSSTHLTHYRHCVPRESMRQVVGSAYYTAPEVLKADYDQRCDVWSLGVIAYMLLTGVPPFNGDSSEKIHNLILTAEVDFSGRVFQKASPSTVEFVKMMLTKDPNARLTIEQACTHPFIMKVREPSPTTRQPAGSVSAPSIDVYYGLTRFLKMTPARRFLMLVVAFSLKPAQVATLRGDFHAFDRQRTGTLLLSELHEGMKAFSQDDASIAERAALFGQV